jgi:hypothetical protein
MVTEIDGTSHAAGDTRWSQRSSPSIFPWVGFTLPTSDRQMLWIFSTAMMGDLKPLKERLAMASQMNRYGKCWGLGFFKMR